MLIPKQYVPICGLYEDTNKAAYQADRPNFIWAANINRFHCHFEDYPNFLHPLWLRKSKSSKLTSRVKCKFIICKDFTLYLKSTFMDFTDLCLLFRATNNWVTHQRNAFFSCLRAPDKLGFLMRIAGTSLSTNKMLVWSKRKLTDIYLQVDRYSWIAFQLHTFPWYAT